MRRIERRRGNKGRNKTNKKTKLEYLQGYKQ